MSQTADRYAKALFELVKQQGSLDVVQDSMTDIRKLIIESLDFRLFLNNPILSYEERCVILKALFETKIPPIAYNFLLFITHKKRLGILKSIIESFDHLYTSSTDQLRAYVTTALPINETDKGYFDARLHEKFKHKMLIRWSTDPELIGGFRIFLQDKMYDYSFKNQLNNFYQQTTQSV